jgi:hypothetical protein
MREVHAFGVKFSRIRGGVEYGAAQFIGVFTDYSVGIVAAKVIVEPGLTVPVI